MAHYIPPEIEAEALADVPALPPLETAPPRPDDYALIVSSRGAVRDVDRIGALYTFASRDQRDAAAVALAPSLDVLELRLGSKMPSGAAMVSSWDRQRDSILQLRGIIAEHRRKLDGLD